MKLVELRQTCSACPSQWEGKTANGNLVYVRYRGGRLTVQIGRPGEDVMMVCGSGITVYREQIGDNLDGVIEWEQVAELTGLQF